MIHLDVQEYCHQCTQFEPEKETTYLFSDGIKIASDNKIYCKHFSKCEIIAAHIKRKLSEEKKDDQG